MFAIKLTGKAPTLFSALVAAALFAATPVLAQEATLTGVWVLNEPQSDNAEARLREAMQEAGGGPGGQRGRGGMGNGGMGRGRGGRSGADGSYADGQGGGGNARGTPPSLQGFVVTARVLSIGQNGVELTLADDNGSQRTVYTDGRGSTVSANGSTDQLRTGVTVAGWEDGQVVIETTRNDGTLIIERLRLAPDGKRLFVATSVKPTQLTRPVSINRVYDARDTSSGP